ncbi:GAF domain-containing protein [Ralstonia syzygii]|nr:GAF domain-containing protein [Ralstonia syzygii]
MKADTTTLSVAIRLAEHLQVHLPRRAAWTALDAALAEVFGHRLFTVLVYDDCEQRLVRVHSSRPDINPVGGCKAVLPGLWTRQVLIEGAAYIGRTREDLRDVFADHEVLFSIGCESVLNIPIRRGGITLGSLNLLNGPGAYRATDIPTAKLFAQLVSAAMHAEYMEITGRPSLPLL